jgi:non-ribosomal peptide synthetase component F
LIGAACIVEIFRLFAVVNADSRLTLPELLADRAAEEPEQPALVVDGVGVLSFGEWDRRSNALAHALIDRGLPDRGLVGLVSGERDEAPLAGLAADLRERCIGGAGVARGYRDRAALTAERSVPDP